MRRFWEFAVRLRVEIVSRAEYVPIWDVRKLSLRLTSFRRPRAIGSKHRSMGQAEDAANPNGKIMSGSMPARVIACVISGLLAVAAGPREACAQTPDSIAVEGNQRIEAATVRSYFEMRDGKLDETAVDTGLKKLLATGLFDKAEIKRRGEQIVVNVVEAPLLGKVAFEGNKKIEDKKLSGVVQTRPGGTLQRALVQADVERIVEVYRGAGRDDVRIVPQTIQHGDRLDLVFSITEGAKTPVRQISFVGNQTFGERQLKAVIKTGESNFLSFLLSNDIYDPDKVEADREALRRYYLSKGYADVSVPAAAAEYDPAKNGFDVKFRIDEGPRLSLRPRRCRQRRSRTAAGRFAAAAGGARGWHLRQHRAGKVDRRPHHRTGQARLSVREDRFAHPARSRQPPDRHPSHDRQWTANLRRAHRYPRQQAHPRLRDPP